MISITCTHCQTVLNIDDAFAGGVCRCQHCGTIQTVPAHLKNGAPPAPAASKALYQNKARASAGAAPQGARRELDDLAQAVASSGLSNSGLSGSGSGLSNRSGSFPASTGRTSPRPAGPVKAASPAPATEQEQRRERKSVPLVPVLVIGGVLLVALIGLGVFLALHGGDSSGTTATTNTGGTGGTAVSGPGLCGVSIAAPSIVYVLDRGNAIANVFDPLKAATYHSLESLGPDRKFEVILWNNGGDDIAYPADSLANATPEEIEKCKRTLEDIVGTGNSHLRSALDKAMARQPSAIVIATGKDRLDDDDELALASAQEVAKGKVKFYTFAVGKQIENPVLKMAASATGGQYRQVSETELRNAP